MRTESALRKRLERNGYALRKSRAKRIHADNLGGYMIINPNANCAVRGSRFELTLEDVNDFCEEVVA